MASSRLGIFQNDSVHISFLNCEYHRFIYVYAFKMVICS